MQTPTTGIAKKMEFFSLREWMNESIKLQLKIRMIMLTTTEINLIAEATAKRVHAHLDKVMNSKQCADMLGITVDALHKRCKRGQIPHNLKHGVLYFSKNAVTAYYLK